MQSSIFTLKDFHNKIIYKMLIKLLINSNINLNAVCKSFRETHNRFALCYIQKYIKTIKN